MSFQNVFSFLKKSVTCRWNLGSKSTYSTHKLFSWVQSTQINIIPCWLFPMQKNIFHVICGLQATTDVKVLFLKPHKDRDVDKQHSTDFLNGILLNSFAVFSKIFDITNALLKSEIDGAFVDSFTITAHLDLIRDHPIRIERTIEHPVVYGLVLAGNSSRMAECTRRYVENYPRKVFQRIADHLKPLKVHVLIMKWKSIYHS